MTPPATTPAPGARPRALSLAAGLLVLVAVLAFGYGVLGLLVSGGSRAAAESGVGILMIGYAVLLLVTARGVRLGRRWSRAPAIATQLLQVPMAVSLGDGAPWWFAVALGAVSVAVVVCLLLPSSTAAFVADAERTEAAAAEGSAPE